MRPGAQALGAQQHTFCSHFKHVLSRNLDQSMLKNAYFLKKKKIVYIVSALEALPPNPVCLRRLSALLFPPTFTTLSSSFLVLNAFYSV